MDIMVKLKSLGVPPPATLGIMELLQEEDYLNEERYSGAFVRDKFNFNKWGRLKIAAALKTKSIPDALIRSALESIDNKSYRDTLERLLDSRSKTIRAKNNYELRGKLYRFGLSRGFESSVLHELLDET
jgi:regulatory protein